MQEHGPIAPVKVTPAREYKELDLCHHESSSSFLTLSVAPPALTKKKSCVLPILLSALLPRHAHTSGSTYSPSWGWGVNNNKDVTGSHRPIFFCPCEYKRRIVFKVRWKARRSASLAYMSYTGKVKRLWHYFVILFTRYRAQLACQNISHFSPIS